MEDQKQRVYDALNKMGIKYEVVEHEPVHTMEDMDRLGLPEKGTLCKNLFLRDSKGKRHFLITADEKTKLDLKALGRQLGAGTLSFASEERLEKYLGVKQGSVTPFLTLVLCSCKYKSYSLLICGILLFLRIFSCTITTAFFIFQSTTCT